MPGIYLHIPFCKQACNYCDFHFSTQLKNKTELVNALCGEIEQRKNYLKDKTINTIYFGGGTPSVLDNDELEKIFEALRQNFSWSKDAEITLECNPDDLTKEKLKQLKQTGINRLSIGLQSFNEQELEWMNRAHNAEQSVQCVKEAQDAGFENITIDLIYGSKFQTVHDWEKTLEKAVELNVQHISAYNLTVEKKTALGVAVDRKEETPIDEEKSSKQFLLMIDLLQANGFVHYEISNFAKPNFESKHNSNYWKGEYYLGIGPSAHSYNGHSRQWNVSNNAVYTKGINHKEPVFEMEVLSPADKYNEYILTSLRTIWGCDKNQMLKLFGESYEKHFEKEIQSYFPKYVSETNGVFVLTREGKLLADKIASALFV